jgi:hypothetical protein
MEKSSRSLEKIISSTVKEEINAVVPVIFEKDKNPVDIEEIFALFALRVEVVVVE